MQKTENRCENINIYTVFLSHYIRFKTGNRHNKTLANGYQKSNAYNNLHIFFL